MKTTVKLNYLRVAPRKTRLVIDTIRGKSAEKAMEKLTFMEKSVAPAILKLLKNGLSSAKEKNMNAQNLLISSIYCDEGPALKRRRLNSRGSASGILKRTSHVTMVLKESEAKKIKPKGKK